MSSGTATEPSGQPPAGRVVRSKGRLPTKPAAGAAFRITDCHRLLLAEFGDQAPSLVTLKRHAAKSKLAHAVHRAGEGSRTLYKYRAIRDFYMPAGAVKPATAETPATPATPATASIGGLNPALLKDELREILSEMLAPVLQRAEQATRAADNLENVRRTLMLKYDANAAAAHTALEQVKEQNRDLRRAADAEGQLRQLQISMRRLAEEVAELRVAVRGRV